jgi:hypothetical protein
MSSNFIQVGPLSEGRFAELVVSVDPATGLPVGATISANASIGVSNFDTIELPPLTTIAQPLSVTSQLYRSIQIQAIKPDGEDNAARIAIGDSVAQTFYLKPGDVWGDSVPLGQTLDISQIYVRALTSGDCISLMVRV